MRTTPSQPSWIGCWIDKPPGERGRINREDRLGWGKPEIMKATGIMEEQYSWYMKSAHRLCSHYFDITKAFNDNHRTRPAKYSLIVAKMKELHPAFDSTRVIGSPATLSLLIASYMNRHKRKQQKEAQQALNKRKIGAAWTEVQAQAQAQHQLGFGFRCQCQCQCHGHPEKSGQGQGKGHQPACRSQ